MKKYLKSWFIVDFIAVLPLSLFFNNFLSLFRLLKIIKLLNTKRLNQISSQSNLLNKLFQKIFINPGLIRLIFISFLVLLFSHWIAIGWILLHDQTNIDNFTIYIQALYWSVTTITTIGYGDITPQTNHQMIYTMLVMFFGASMYAYVIGSIASIFSNMDIVKSSHVNKMEEINAFMKFRSFPISLQKKVRAYYNYLFERKLELSEDEFFKDLPRPLVKEIKIHLNKELLEKVPFLKGANENLITELVLALKPIVFLPGEFIFKKGEIANEIYFISKGQISITSYDGKIEYAKLNEGNYFGEMSLLKNLVRTASAVALDYCDLYTIDKQSFFEVIKKFPDFKKEILKEMKKRQQDREKLK